jgi:hypothetical protein
MAERAPMDTWLPAGVREADAADRAVLEDTPQDWAPDVAGQPAIVVEVTRPRHRRRTLRVAAGAAILALLAGSAFAATRALDSGGKTVPPVARTMADGREPAGGDDRVERARHARAMKRARAERAGALRAARQREREQRRRIAARRRAAARNAAAPVSSPATSRVSTPVRQPSTSTPGSSTPTSRPQRRAVAPRPTPSPQRNDDPDPAGRVPPSGG